MTEPKSEIVQAQDSRRTFVEALIELAERDDRIVWIVPDVGFNYVNGFQDRFPDRFFNLGITEFSAMIIAAGMALSGLKPYYYSMIPFSTFRVHEQIRNAVCLHNANVKIMGVKGSVHYAMLGPSHNLLWDTEDVDMMGKLPGMECYVPENNEEVRRAVFESYKRDNPSYIRL